MEQVNGWFHLDSVLLGNTWFANLNIGPPEPMKVLLFSGNCCESHIQLTISLPLNKALIQSSHNIEGYFLIHTQKLRKHISKGLFTVWSKFLTWLLYFACIIGKKLNAKLQPIEVLRQKLTNRQTGAIEKSWFIDQKTWQSQWSTALHSACTFRARF